MLAISLPPSWVNGQGRKGKKEGCNSPHLLPRLLGEGGPALPLPAAIRQVDFTAGGGVWTSAEHTLKAKLNAVIGFTLPPPPTDGKIANFTHTHAMH